MPRQSGNGTWSSCRFQHVGNTAICCSSPEREALWEADPLIPPLTLEKWLGCVGIVFPTGAGRTCQTSLKPPVHQKSFMEAWKFRVKHWTSECFWSSHARHYLCLEQVCVVKLVNNSWVRAGSQFKDLSISSEWLHTLTVPGICWPKDAKGGYQWQSQLVNWTTHQPLTKRWDDWLIDWLSEWLSDWLIDWFAARVRKSRYLLYFSKVQPELGLVILNYGAIVPHLRSRATLRLPDHRLARDRGKHDMLGEASANMKREPSPNPEVFSAKQPQAFWYLGQPQVPQS